MDSALHREMHRRGDCLTTTARTSISSTLDNLVRQQKTLEDEIDQKTDMLRTVKAAISLETALLAPIRSVPREILSHIFSLAREDYISVFYDDTLIVIGQVCKLWRSLTRSTPTLWADLRIIIDIDRPRNPHLRIDNIIQRALVLSDPLPLDLTVVLPSFLPDEEVDVQYMQKDAPQVVDLITRHLCRWRSLDFNGSSEDLSRIIRKAQGTKMKFPKLKTLKLFCNGDIPEGNPRSAVFSDISILKTNFSPEIVTTEWTNLTSFSGVFSNGSTCYYFLANAPCLSNIHIRHISADNVLQVRQRDVLTLSNVQSLVISDCVILQIVDYLCLPNLEELNTEDGDLFHQAHGEIWADPCRVISTKPAPRLIQNLIMRSGCALRVLSMDEFMEFERCVSLLEACSPTLTSLTLGFDTEVHDDLTPILTALTVSNGSTLLPRLSELFIDATRGLGNDILVGSCLDTMIQSRHASNDVSDLTKLTLRLENSMYHLDDSAPSVWHASGLMMTLLKLENDGLQVDWKRGAGLLDVMEKGRMFAKAVSHT